MHTEVCTNSTFPSHIIASGFGVLGYMEYMKELTIKESN